MHVDVDYIMEEEEDSITSSDVLQSVTHYFMGMDLFLQASRNVAT